MSLKAMSSANLVSGIEGGEMSQAGLFEAFALELKNNVPRPIAIAMPYNAFLKRRMPLLCTLPLL